jgi:hypothetical protein
MADDSPAEGAVPTGRRQGDRVVATNVWALRDLFPLGPLPFSLTSVYIATFLKKKLYLIIKGNI